MVAFAKTVMLGLSVMSLSALSVHVHADGTQRRTIAVFDLELAGPAARKVVTETAQDHHRVTRTESHETPLLRDRIVAALTRTGAVRVVERAQMGRILDEIDLSGTELTDPGHSIELGRLLGADYLLFGTISMLDGSIEHETLPYGAGTRTIKEYLVGAGIRMVDSRTGEVVLAENLQVSNKEVLLRQARYKISEGFRQSAYDMMASEIADAIMYELFPTLVASYSEGTVYLNRGGLETGSRKQVVRAGDAIVDPVSGEVLGTSETSVAIIEITESSARFSQARVVEWLGGEAVIPVGATVRPAR